MAYLKEAQQFLTKLPSISLEGIEPLGDHCPPKEQKVTVHSCAFNICPSDHAQPSCFASPGSEHHAVVEQKDFLIPSKCMYTPNSSLPQFAYVDIYDSGGARFQAGLHSNPKEAIGRCDGDSAADPSLSRSLKRGKKTMPLKEKRKVGRPIAYCGDPESPNLTPAERRRIKRRIANRESARRVRARRQDTIEEMVVRARQMKDQNMQLVERASTLENEHAIVLAQLCELERRLQYITVENEKLAGDIYCLRNETSVASVPPPHDIDRHEHQPTKPMPVLSVDYSSKIPMAVGGSAFTRPMTRMGISTEGVQTAPSLHALCMQSASTATQNMPDTSEPLFTVTMDLNKDFSPASSMDQLMLDMGLFSKESLLSEMC